MIPLNLPTTGQYPKTLNEVTAYKIQIKKELDAQQLITAHSLRGLLPERNASPLSFLTKNLTRSMSMVDGILLGLKAVRLIRKYIARNRL